MSFPLNPVWATDVPQELKDIGITEHLGDQLPLSEFHFRDEEGKSVSLADYFQKGRPVLLSLVYFQCPNLCIYMRSGLVQSLKTLDWTVGENFELVTVSIDPKEGPELASKKKEVDVKAYGRPESASAWHYLTGDEDQIKKLASRVGFGYRWDENEKQYAHSAALFVLTPEGKISRYLYGIEYKSTDMKLALLEASNGKIGTVIERFLLFCYRYDPHLRRYSVYLTKLMQTSCGVTVLVFGGYLVLFWSRQKKGA